MANWNWLLVLSALTLACCIGGCQKTSDAPPETAIKSQSRKKPRAKRISNSVPWKPKAKERKWKYIVIHHTATERGNVASIHSTHRQRKDRNGNPWLGIGYHFVIGNGNGMPDGAIEPTFRWNKQIHGAHAGNWEHNKFGIGIALVGNFEQAAPSSAQWKSVTTLIRTLKTRYQIKTKHIMGHNEIKATQCPGKHFPLHKISRQSRLIDLGYRVPAKPQMTR